MRFRFKQKMFTWFDTYDIFDEMGNVAFHVKGQLSWGHCLKIYGANGMEIGMVKERIFTFLPKFELYIMGNYAGSIHREFTFLKPRYVIDFNGWQIEGNFMQWDYSIYNFQGQMVASVSKELFRLTDTYTIDVMNPQDALAAVMFVIAIDAEKCSRN